MKVLKSALKAPINDGKNAVHVSKTPFDNKRPRLCRRKCQTSGKLRAVADRIHDALGGRKTYAGK
jgi:hypothetical protein